MTTAAPAPLPARACAPRSRALTGAQALADLVRVLRGPASPERGAWSARVMTRSGVQGVAMHHLTGEPGSDAAVIERVAARVAGGDRACLLTRLRLRGSPGTAPGAGGRESTAAVLVRVNLRSYYAPGGPLQGELPPSELGRTAPTLGAAQWSRARAFAWREVQRACFAPTRVIDRGWVWDLIYVVRPYAADPSLDGLLASPAAEALAALLRAGAVAPDPDLIDVTELLAPADAPGWRARVLVPERRVVWRSVRDLRGAACRVVAAFRAAHAAPRRDRRAGEPAAMALPTLPLDWGLPDLPLDRVTRERLAGSGARLEEWRPPDVRALLRTLAEHGYGWPDVEALADDPRFSLAGALRLEPGRLARWRREFAALLAWRHPACAVRLPFGLVSLERVPGALPGERPRFVLRGRSSGRAFELTVDWATLASAPALVRALEARLERMLPRLPAAAWRAVLDLALRDPRVARRAPGDAPAERALTDHIRAFLGLPADDDVVRSSRVPAGWPLARDGELRFPRPVLERFLAARGVAFRRAELTAALLSLGGGPRGVQHVPRSGKIRVWGAPVPR